MAREGPTCAYRCLPAGSSSQRRLDEAWYGWLRTAGRQPYHGRELEPAVLGGAPPAPPSPACSLRRTTAQRLGATRRPRHATPRRGPTIAWPRGSGRLGDAPPDAATPPPTPPLPEVRAGLTPESGPIPCHGWLPTIAWSRAQTGPGRGAAAGRRARPRSGAGEGPGGEENSSRLSLSVATAMPGKILPDARILSRCKQRFSRRMQDSLSAEAKFLSRRGREGRKEREGEGGRGRGRKAAKAPAGRGPAGAPRTGAAGSKLARRAGTQGAGRVRARTGCLSSPVDHAGRKRSGKGAPPCKQSNSPPPR